MWYSFVYAHCNKMKREALWDSLIDIADTVDVPWLVGGDFNTIAQPEENFGKIKANEKSILDFNNFLMRAGLSNTNFSGNSFTWTNNRQGDDLFLKGLTDSWLMVDLFQNMVCQELPILLGMCQITLRFSAKR